MIKKILLPKMPDDLIDEIYKSIRLNSDKAWKGDFDMYAWMPATDKIQDWCKQNISPDLYWGVQLITNDLPMHKDHGTEIKFNYVITQGSSDVRTNYYDDNKTLISSNILDAHTWYILNVSVFHSVTGMKDGMERISITSRIMP
jgi:hypothetical protein